MNVLLCDACWGRRADREEKSCTHGVHGGKCVECGAVVERLHCLGSMRLRLLPGRVAVRELLPLKVGRIYLPDNFHETKENEEARTSHRARVLAVGPPARTAKGVELAPEFSIGDVVIFVFGLQGCEKYRRGVWLGDGEPCTWIAQEEVIAIVDGEEELAPARAIVEVPPKHVSTFAAGAWTRGGRA